MNAIFWLVLHLCSIFLWATPQLKLMCTIPISICSSAEVLWWVLCVSVHPYTSMFCNQKLMTSYLVHRHLRSKARDLFLVTMTIDFLVLAPRSFLAHMWPLGLLRYCCILTPLSVNVSTFRNENSEWLKNLDYTYGESLATKSYLGHCDFLS